MPTKHSKNNTARGFFTYDEKLKAGYGSLHQRFGKDSTKPFDHCTLCLQPLRLPMTTSGGHLFCKECIYSNLLAQKKEIKRQLALWEKYQETIQNEAAAIKDKKREEQRQKFEKASNGISSSSDMLFSSAKSSEKVLEQADKGNSLALIVVEKDKESDVNIDAMKRVESRVDSRLEKEKSISHNYWLPNFTPEAAVVMKKPDARTICPTGTQYLRLKQLYPLHFSEIDESESKNSSASGGRYQCPSCLRTLNHQAVTAFKKCGHVLCSSCVKKFVKPTDQCFVCAKPIKKKEYIELEKGGTGFASHNNVTATKYRPSR